MTAAGRVRDHLARVTKLRRLIPSVHADTTAFFVGAVFLGLSTLFCLLLITAHERTSRPAWKKTLTIGEVL
jgi:hypothetical protein